MKITKYNHSCLLIEANNKRILVDPGIIGYNDEILAKYWQYIDCILVTHKHDDHCNAIAIDRIVARDNCKFYTSYEVVETQPIYGALLVKPGDVIDLENNIRIGVVRAVHGYLPKMKGNEVKTNLGYIIDDGKCKVYITSDSICFDNGIKCDVICMPFNGNGLTFGEYDGSMYAKACQAKLVLPIHMEHPDPNMMPNLYKLDKHLKEVGIEYKILDFNESIEI